MGDTAELPTGRGLSGTYLDDVERTIARHPRVPSAMAEALLSEVRRLEWELENARKLAIFWKSRKGSISDGEADGLRVVAG